MNSVLTQQKRLAGNSVRHQDRLNEISRMLEPTSSRPLPASSSDASDKQAQKDDDISGHLNTINDTIGTLSDRLSQVEYSKGAKDQEASAVKEAMKDFFEKLKTKESTDAQSQLPAQYQHIIERIDGLERLHKDQDKDREGGATPLPTPSEYRKLWQNEIRDVIEGIRANESEKAAREKEAMLSLHSRKMEQLSETHELVVKRLLEQSANSDKANKELMKATKKRWLEQLSALQSGMEQASGKFIADIAKANSETASEILEKFQPNDQVAMIQNAIENAFQKEWKPYIEEQIEPLRQMVSAKDQLRERVEAEMATRDKIFADRIVEFNKILKSTSAEKQAANALVNQANNALQAASKHQTQLQLESSAMLEGQRKAYQQEILRAMGLDNEGRSLAQIFADAAAQQREIENWMATRPIHASADMLALQTKVDTALKAVSSLEAEKKKEIGLLPVKKLQEMIDKATNSLRIEFSSQVPTTSTALTTVPDPIVAGQIEGIKGAMQASFKEQQSMRQYLTDELDWLKDQLIQAQKREKVLMLQSQQTTAMAQEAQREMMQIKSRENTIEQLSPIAATSTAVGVFDDYQSEEEDDQNEDWPMAGNQTLPKISYLPQPNDFPQGIINFVPAEVESPAARLFWEYFGNGAQAGISHVDMQRREGQLKLEGYEITDQMAREMHGYITLYAKRKIDNPNYQMTLKDLIESETAAKNERERFITGTSRELTADDLRVVPAGSEGKFDIFRSMGGDTFDDVRERWDWVLSVPKGKQRQKRAELVKEYLALRKQHFNQITEKTKAIAERVTKTGQKHLHEMAPAVKSRMNKIITLADAGAPKEIIQHEAGKLEAGGGWMKTLANEILNMVA